MQGMFPFLHEQRKPGWKLNGPSAHRTVISGTVDSVLNLERTLEDSMLFEIPRRKSARKHNIAAKIKLEGLCITLASVEPIGLSDERFHSISVLGWGHDA